MTLLQIFKIISASLSICVFIPGETVALPTAVYLFSIFAHVNIFSVSAFLISGGAIAYLLFSSVRNFNNKSDTMVTIGILSFYILFLLFHSQAILRSGLIEVYATAGTALITFIMTIVLAAIQKRPIKNKYGSL